MPVPQIVTDLLDALDLVDTQGDTLATNLKGLLGRIVAEVEAADHAVSVEGVPAGAEAP